VFSKPPTGTLGALPQDGELTPEEQEAWDAGVARVEQEKHEALLDPGSSWREWFFYDAMKWWVGLGFLIVDVLICGSWITQGSFSQWQVVGAALSLLAALYLEILLYRYLWRRPSETELRRPGPFRPNLLALREVGRWTPEGDPRSAHYAARRSTDGTPRPEEFL